MSDDFRTNLNIYSGRLSDERDQLSVNFKLMWDEHVITHPSVGIYAPDTGVTDSRFTLNQPIAVLCKDPVFNRQFNMTEIWHQSTMLRMDRFKGWSQEFLAVLDEEIAALQ